MYMTCKYKVTPLSAISILWNARAHICSSNSGDVVFYIEAPINE